MNYSPAVLKMADEMFDALTTTLVEWNAGYDTSAVMNRLKPESILGHRYSGGNRLRLAVAPYSIPVFATLRQVNAAGGRVRKGSKSIRLIFWKEYRKKGDAEDEKPRKMLRVFQVFNVEQTDGIDLSKWMKPEPETQGVQREDLLAAIESLVKIKKDWQGNPTFMFEKNCIGMPAFGKWESEAIYFKTLFHEITHWAGVASGVDTTMHERMSKHGFGSPDYGRWELVAEIGSLFIAADLNVAFDLPNSAAYIQSWIDSLRKKDKVNIKTTLLEACADAERIRNWFLWKLRGTGLEGVPDSPEPDPVFDIRSGQGSLLI